MTADPRFDEAEADVDRGTPWRFREPDIPNPLTIQVTEWSTGVTKLGEAEFMNGVDRDGKRWSILVGCVVLRKLLIDGLIEEWGDDRGAFVETRGSAASSPARSSSIKYLGDREGVQYNYPDFRVSRKSAGGETSEAEPKPSGQLGLDDAIPFAASAV